MFPLETIVARAKRRGFVYPGSDIYGWLANAWDYGPYGVQLKKNIADLWRKIFIQERDDMIGLDSQILMHPKVWEASGHVAGFNDPLIDDKNTWERFRADKLIEEKIETMRKEYEKKIANKSVYLVVEKSLRPGTVAQLDQFGHIEIRETNQEWWSFYKVYLAKDREDDFVAFILNSMQKNEFGHWYTDSCGTSNKVIFSDGSCFDVSTTMWCEEAKARGIALWIKPEQVNFGQNMLSSTLPWYIDAQILKNIHLDVDKQIHNLIPESRTFDQMKAFIVKEIPNNPTSKKKADRTDVRKFSGMFYTYQWVVHDDDNKIWMRPETAQGIFINFKNVIDTTRMRVPFGIGQVGKAFRNEITPGNFLYRTREFEQMEIEYFVENDPKKADEAFSSRREASMRRWQDHMQFKPEHVRFRQHEADELSHYSAGTFDVEFQYPRWRGELQWIANRTDFDLKAHQEHSKQSMQYTDPYSWKRYIPWVIEPSFGLSRTVLASMFDSYDEEAYISWNGQEETRVVVRFPFAIAPVKLAIFPLIKKDEQQVAIAEELFRKLAKITMVEYDDGWAIGKRYRRQDEIGTPRCLTVDHETVASGMVTVRNRDSMEQISLHKDEVVSWIEKELKSD